MQNEVMEGLGERLIGHAKSGLMEKIYIFYSHDLDFDSTLASSWPPVIGHVTPGIQVCYLCWRFRTII